MDSKLKISINKAAALATQTKQEVIVIKSINGYRATVKAFVKHNKYEAILKLEGTKIIVKDAKGKIIEKLDPVESKKKATDKTAANQKEDKGSQDSKKK